MELIRKRLLLGFFIIFSHNLQALSIQNLNVDLDPNVRVQYIEINNTTLSRKAYVVSLVQVDVPKRSGNEKQINDGSLLYSPQRLVLNSGDRSGFKFFYQGELDEKERYFRVKLVEMPVSADMMGTNKNELLYDYNTAVEIIMVVRPAKPKFDYLYVSGKIQNTGNTYFKYMSSDKCDKHYAQSRFIPPGESLPLINEAHESNRVIVYGNKIITLSQCATEK